MPTGKFYLDSIGSVHLSSDGTADGNRCKLEVENVAVLLRTVTGVSIPAAGGTRVNQVVPWTAGKPFAVRISVIGSDEWSDLKTLMDNSILNDTTFTVAGTGTPGNFSVTAEADPENPYTWESFTSTRINNLILRFFTK